jgi:hypothetical protein
MKGTMSYEITITETRTVKKVLPKQWKVIGTKEVERNLGFYEGRIDEPRTRTEEVYGYTPEVETVQQESREVLKQEVDELDLKAVIIAINGLAETTLAAPAAIIPPDRVHVIAD